MALATYGERGQKTLSVSESLKAMDVVRLDWVVSEKEESTISHLLC